MSEKPYIFWRAVFITFFVVFFGALIACNL